MPECSISFFDLVKMKKNRELEVIAKRPPFVAMKRDLERSVDFVRPTCLSMSLKLLALGLAALVLKNLSSSSRDDDSFHK